MWGDPPDSVRPSLTSPSSMRLGTNHVSSWVYVIGQVGAGIVMVLVTPWKINMEPQKLEVWFR